MYVSRHCSLTFSLVRHVSFSVSTSALNKSQFFINRNSSNIIIFFPLYFFRCFFLFSLTFFGCVLCVILQAPAFISVLALSQTTAYKVLTVNIPQNLESIANYWCSTGMAIVFNAMDNGQCINILRYAEVNHKYVLGIDS